MNYRMIDSGICMMHFEGVTVRTDAVDVLRITLDQAVTCGDVALKRGRSAGAISNTMKRMAAAGLLDVVELPPSDKAATRWRALIGYRTTDKGRRLLAAADKLLSEFGDEDEDDFPKIDPAMVISQALATQPNSVFDLGRLAGY